MKTPSARRTMVAIGVCIAIALYETLLLGNFRLALLAPESMDHVFGSMLDHLLQGRFDIDRAAIGSESFTRDGKTYAYFGIFPALLRLLVMPFADVTQASVSRLSCMVAMLLYVLTQLRTLMLVHVAVPPEQRSQTLLIVMLIATALSGPQIYLLGSAWVFHEPVFWAAAMGGAFNLVVLRRLLLGARLNAADLAVMALLAGLALNTRASVGAALSVATGLVVLWMALERGAWSLRGTARGLLDARVVAPALVLGVFVLAVCIVNAERWGNPFKFADFQYYDFAKRQPWRMPVILGQGELSPSRIPVSVLYYATGIPYLLKGISPFAEYFRAHFDGLEAPPMSGLIVNPLTVILAGLGLYRLVRQPPTGAVILRLVLIGHATAVILVFSAMYLAMRYRMDFAPFMTLAGFVGYPVASAALTASRYRCAWRRAAIALCVLGIVSSHYVLVIHKVWSPGVQRDIRLQFLPYAPFAHAALDQ